jgi:protein transport protein YIF1
LFFLASIKVKSLLHFSFKKRPCHDWSIKFATDVYMTLVPPKLDLNAPDLYKPVMAFVTDILMVGIAYGRQGKFTPELLGLQASSALAWYLFEV